MDDIRTEAAGATFSFRTVSGEVLGTDQRSDSYTTGSSRTVIYEGSGGGHGHVSTKVVVNRDIWFRDGEGQEHHVRVNADIPVRVGQHVAVAYLEAERAASGRSFDRLVSIHVLTTDRYTVVRPFSAIARYIVERAWTQVDKIKVVLAFVLALGLCFIVVGIPLVIGLFVWLHLRERKLKALAAELAAALEAGHLETLRSTLVAFRVEQRRVAELGTAEKRRAIGAAS